MAKQKKVPAGRKSARKFAKRMASRRASEPSMEFYSITAQIQSGRVKTLPQRMLLLSDLECRPLCLKGNRHLFSPAADQ